MGSNNPKRKLDDLFDSDDSFTPNDVAGDVADDVAMSYRLATIGQRMFAQFMDYAFVWFISLYLIGVLGFLGAAFSMIVYFAYHVFFWVFNNGQTPGKMIFGIRVIKVDGTAITAYDATLRYIGYILNNVIPLLWLWAFFDRDKQGAHDKLAKTYVVQNYSAQPVIYTRDKVTGKRKPH